MLTLLKKARLADALLDDYEEVITGYIVDAQIVAGCLVGAAYKACGYAKGEHLISGSIIEVIEYDRRWLVKTRELECLVIVNFAPGGRRALLHLINLFETAHLAKSRWCLH
ncbi:hypothetical protein [Ectopseudomonas oleovorans]|jgi:hypothetical protein|uniref:hypothetical protein n=1 Tax=Ectopseudomonas oleovorans TaxID=301 RepID=UPI0024202601|nr:hypothetical protein [Pseudomonas oleovorans]